MASSRSERASLLSLRLSRRPQAGRHSRKERWGRPLAIEPLEGRVLLASNWTELTNGPPAAVGTMLLLTNGDVMAQSTSGPAGVSSQWYLLTPSSTGSYVNGTWTTLSSMALNRLYFASDVMQNGNVFVEGGEYSGSSGAETLTNAGEIYNTVTNSWSPVATFPQANFGDDPAMLLPNGNILAGYVFGPQTYIYNVTNNTWSQTGTKQNNDASDEEGWVKLPDSSILSYNVFSNTGNEPGQAQRYIPSTGQWVNTGTVPVALSNTKEYELGPSALLPNGKVIYIGAAQITNGLANTAIFDPTGETNTGGGTWTAGPTIPGGYVADDAAGVLLPNGQFIFTADQPGFGTPTHVFDYNYLNNTITDITPSTANGDPPFLVESLPLAGSFVDRFLMLPNGQALFTAGTSTGTGLLWVYTGTGSVNSSSTPSISGIVNNGSNNYTLNGSALSGASQGASYGDDAQMDTNYPIVSVATDIGTVYYARTTNWNATGVGTTNGATSVTFTLPSAISTPPVVTLSAPSSPVVGQALTNVTVATFTDPNGNHTGDYSAIITWGDGRKRRA